MAKTLPSVSVVIPKPGEQTHSAALDVAEGEPVTVRVELPALAFRSGKYCRVVLQWERGRSEKPDSGAYYGIPGRSWNLGKGSGIKETVDLGAAPRGATGVRLSLFTDVEACTATPEDEAKLFRA